MRKYDRGNRFTKIKRVVKGYKTAEAEQNEKKDEVLPTVELVSEQTAPKREEKQPPSVTEQPVQLKMDEAKPVKHAIELDELNHVDQSLMSLCDELLDD